MISCKNFRNTEEFKALEETVSSYIGKKLLLPDTLIVYKPFTNYYADSAEMFNSEFKIYTLINGSCGTCIDNIILWNDLVYELQPYHVPVIVIFESDDNFELLKYFCEENKISNFLYPFFLDINRNYLKFNKFMQQTSFDLKTVLTDKDDNILLIGNPINNNKVQELILNAITES